MLTFLLVGATLRCDHLFLTLPAWAYVPGAQQVFNEQDWAPVICSTKTIQPFVAMMLGLLAACSGSPTIGGNDTVSVQIFSDSDFYLDLERSRYADPDLAPGKLAGEGAAQAMRDCASLWESDASLAAIMAPFCVLSGAAIGAAAGAVAQGVEGAPKEAGANLQSVIDTANAENTADIWRAMLQSRLETEARHRGKNVVAFPEGETVYVVVEDLYWKPSAGERLTISGKFVASTRSGDSFARRRFSVASRPYEIEEWLADGGEHFSDELRLFLEEVADRVWDIVSR